MWHLKEKKENEKMYLNSNTRYNIVNLAKNIPDAKLKINCVSVFYKLLFNPSSTIRYYINFQRK